jgi:hypothetical protein
MRTINSYTLRTCQDKPNWKILNEYAIEKGHTDSMDIYASDSHDFSFTDIEGNKVTVGKRLTKDRKGRIEITIVNSFEKTQKDKEQRELIINND